VPLTIYQATHINILGLSSRAKLMSVSKWMELNGLLPRYLVSSHYLNKQLAINGFFGVTVHYCL